MQSNTKLSKAEKQSFKCVLANSPEVQFATMGGTTIAFQHVGDNVEFSTAICALNEKKNRFKVGKYHAISRFVNGETVKLPFAQFDNMIESAFW